MIRFIIILWVFLTFQPAFADGFTPLATEKAFNFSASINKDHQLILHWDIAPGYFLYQKRINITPTPKKISFPKTILHNHEQVYSEILDIPVTIQGANAQTVLLKIQYQGCAEAGFCYAPIKKMLHVSLNKTGLPEQVDQYVAPKENNISHYLASYWWVRIAAFLGIGFLLALTPCVLPMVPILSAIVLGSARKKNHKRAFFLSLSYVLGMAIAYAFAGVVIALIGRNIQTELQRPWVIILSSMVFVLLALSLLGLYDFRLPSSWQKKLANLSYRQQGGTIFGVFLMGFFSTLIVSPCVSAPLVGILAWIGQTGDVWIGASALLSLGLGMGIPLLLIGLSLDKLLPRTGYWMIVLERIFGVIMLCMAVWMLARLIPTTHSTFFKVINDMPSLNAELELTKKNRQPIILDFYADWCVSCVKMDKEIFARSDIQKALNGFTRLRVDLTNNDETTLAMAKRFQVVGPPTILFFDCAHNWLSSETLIGETNSAKFIAKINKVRSTDSCQLN